jgi:hypothetical protein
VFLDEALQIGLRDELRRRVPDKFSAKLEFAHGKKCALFKGRGQAADWVAHASRVLVSASALRRSLLVISIQREVRDGATHRQHARSVRYPELLV